jgi:hypothetical protein
VNQIEALQAALAGEHASLYAIGVAGGRLRGARFTAARSLYAAHRDRRDRLADLITASGEKPAAAEAAYDLPAPVTNATTAISLIRLVEQRLAAVYGDLVEAAETVQVRTLGVQALLAAAREQVRWGGAPVPFPGAV